MKPAPLVLTRRSPFRACDSRVRASGCGFAWADAMEELVARDYWPVPTYDDILFYV